MHINMFLACDLRHPSNETLEFENEIESWID